MDRSPVHAMTCDVEDYFQVSAFEEIIDRSDWASFKCRIPGNVDKALQMFADKDVKATFFTLGWVAQNFPEVVRRIADEGHEVASHGMQHFRVWTQSADEFRDDAVAARQLLQDVSGQEVVGYRAASWSIDRRTPWAHAILAEAGYQYSSSIYPIRHDHFGMPDAPKHPHRPDQSGVLEIPASTGKLLGLTVPAAGGGYFRLLPFSVSKHLVRKQQESCTYPYVFYFHPWELDPGQPRVSGAPPKARFKHYLNLGKFERRLQAMLESFRWGRMDQLFLGEDH